MSTKLRKQQLLNFQRNNPELYAKYIKLPKYQRGQAVLCPECWSDKVVWSGDVYDCQCGIFFTDFAANPPHQRDK